MTRKPFFVLLLFFLLCGAALPAQQVDPALKEKADKALQAADEAMMRISSGICRITKLGEEDEHSWPNFDSANDFRLIFDCSAGCARFDRGFFDRQVLTPDSFYAVSYSPGAGHAYAHSCPADEYSTTKLVKFRTADIRDFFMSGGLSYRGLLSYEKSFLHTQTRELAKIGYEELPTGQIKVTTFQDNGYPDSVADVRTYVIDPDKGYTVSYFEMNDSRNIARTFLGIFHRQREFHTVFHRSHHSPWENVNGTWVPVSFRFKLIYDHFDVKRESETEWKIDWEQVNAPIDPSLFDPDAILADLEATAPAHIEKDVDEPAAGERCPLRLSDAR